MNVSVCAHTAAHQNRAPCRRNCPIAVFRCAAHHELVSPLVPMSSQACLKGESVPLAMTDVTLNSEGRIWNERRYKWATVCGEVPLCILTYLADGAFFHLRCMSVSRVCNQCLSKNVGCHVSQSRTWRAPTSNTDCQKRHLFHDAEEEHVVDHSSSHIADCVSEHVDCAGRGLASRLEGALVTGIQGLLLFFTA